MKRFGLCVLLGLCSCHPRCDDDGTLILFSHTFAVEDDIDDIDGIDGIATATRATASTSTPAPTTGGLWRSVC